ncbi:MAG: type III-A CRISPR-associated RAMP protein Csm4 [Bacteroidales bacterium]|nr:type III-A CRISPR-associated RAMP protein Csm4 [Bacteroidales bacterium]
MKTILLIPDDHGQFHLGETGLDDTSDVLHSDTFFSALANIYEMALSGAKTLIDHIKSDKLRFSSGFYAVLNGDRVSYFLPKPPLCFGLNDKPKILKNVRYVSVGIWKQLLSDFDPEKLSSEIDLLALPTIGGDFVYAPDELGSIPEPLDNKNIRTIQTIPKVKVHTTAEDTDRLYHETTVQFTPIILSGTKLRGAFYVLYEHKLDPEELAEFLAALRIMADEGVGGERSSGKGQFKDVVFTEVDLPDFANPQAFLGLSLISPSSNEEFHNGLSDYELIIRGGGSIGRMGDTEKHRKRARFVREGALLKNNIRGRFVDVSPYGDNTILRNGFNFAIPMGKRI